MHPYENLPPYHFWKPAVSNINPLDIKGIWDPKFSIEPSDRVVTYGSCFAQHIGNALLDRGYAWYNAEPPPRSLSAKNRKLFNYSVFSSRTQNIYTTSMLEQWVDWSLGEKEIPEEIWERDGRFYDPFRPTVEPQGFSSASELIASRKHTMECFLSSIEKSDVFVFTLGLTERWINKKYGFEYSICPGTTEGIYDESEHQFENLDFPQVRKSLASALQKIKDRNKKIKVLLTVSPVPLVATYENRHVLVSTMESKSTLRSVAGMLAKKRKYVDYFPSYEIINSFPFRGMFFEPNLRNVNHHGVNFVMQEFFSSLDPEGSASKPTSKSKQGQTKKMDIVCEEELLEAFVK